jgi:hypothetical protein
MYGQQLAGAVNEPQSSPVSQEMVKNFDYNLERMHKCVNIIEDKCHALLNLRGPEKKGGEATSIPMEDDVAKAIGNRISQFANLDDRLENIVQHLTRFVG